MQVNTGAARVVTETDTHTDTEQVMVYGMESLQCVFEE